MFIDVDMKIPEVNNVRNAYNTLMDAIYNQTRIKWPITNTMWTHIQYGSLEDYLRQISDCAVPVGFHEHEGVTEYYYRCEYRSYEIGGYITEGNEWHNSETMAKMLRKDPWGRNFITFPHQPEINNKHAVLDIVYKYVPIYKHNRTAIVGHLISTSIDGKIIWCVDMFRNEVI